MNERTLRLLEFDKVKQMLSRHTATSLGRELVEELRPTTNARKIEDSLTRTSEAVALRGQGQPVPLGGLHDIRPILRKAQVGELITPEELLRTSDTLRACSRMRRFLLRHGEVAPTLAAEAAAITETPGLVKRIERVVGDDGRVRDTASTELVSIRNRLRRGQEAVRAKLESIIRSSRYKGMLQEALVTIRNGRHVVPLKQECRGAIQGIIHDQSASGATIFVEPAEVVELNNELRRLEAEEEREVERILREVGSAIGAHHDVLQVNVEVMARLDFAFAKAGLSDQLRGACPTIAPGETVDLRGARHPLLEKPVPIDIRLGADFHTLVITGPNTGGKTVCLKTLGLLCLMAESGLHIPADPRSRLPVYQGIWADIGDEQSIEQNLSTFSSHMTNIIGVLRKASGPDHLALLDEIGAGTDPTEGSALAMAILLTLHNRGVHTVATTHYSQLKSFAYMQEGMENASVEFDSQTLQPTYVLAIGIPGSSNAFDIARRLGLSQEVLALAESFLTTEQLQIDELIRSIESHERSARQKMQDAASASEQARRLEEELERKLSDFSQRRDEMMRRARAEAEQLVKQTRQEMEELIARIERAHDQAEVRELARRSRRRVDETLQRLRVSKEPELTRPSTGTTLEDLALGDAVQLPGLGQEGEVIKLLENNEQVVVQVGGGVKLTLGADQVEKIGRSRKADRRAVSGTTIGLVKRKSQSISAEVHLRGMTVDEALQVTEKYLDDAILAGLKQVRIVHGKGTGKLRREVRRYLDEHPHVISYRTGGPGEGGLGVTVAELAD